MFRHHFDLVEHQTPVKQLLCMAFIATSLRLSVALKVCLCKWDLENETKDKKDFKRKDRKQY